MVNFARAHVAGTTDVHAEASLLSGGSDAAGCSTAISALTSDPSMALMAKLRAEAEPVPPSI
jgi:hypothetical protein